MHHIVRTGPRGGIGPRLALVGRDDMGTRPLANIAEVAVGPTGQRTIWRAVRRDYCSSGGGSGGGRVQSHQELGARVADSSAGR